MSAFLWVIALQKTGEVAGKQLLVVCALCLQLPTKENSAYIIISWRVLPCEGQREKK